MWIMDDGIWRGPKDLKSFVNTLNLVSAPDFRPQVGSPILMSAQEVLKNLGPSFKLVTEGDPEVEQYEDGVKY